MSLGTQYEWCKLAYDKGWATNEKLQIWVNASGERLTYLGYYQITNDITFIDQALADGKITQEEYELIVTP